MQCIIVTNNSYVQRNSQQAEFAKHQIVFVESLNIVDVFVRVRDYVHSGHKVLTHPLSGSVKPAETPFKSIAISADAPGLDYQSLLLIEEAVETTKKFAPRAFDMKTMPSQILDDFRQIDHGLIRSGLISINQF